MFSCGVSVCTHTRQVKHQQNWQSSEKSQNFKEKTQFLMNTLYITIFCEWIQLSPESRIEPEKNVLDRTAFRFLTTTRKGDPFFPWSQLSLFSTLEHMSIIKCIFLHSHVFRNFLISCSVFYVYTGHSIIILTSSLISLHPSPHHSLHTSVTLFIHLVLISI